MNSRPSPTLPTLIRHSVLQAISLAVLVGFLLSFVYGLVHHYQEKRRHIEQLATLLTNSAATANGAALVAKQVNILLENEPSIQSILFYSTTEPLGDMNPSSSRQTKDDWKNALSARTVSLNYPVTTTEFGRVSKPSTNSDTQLAATLSNSRPASITIDDALADSANNGRLDDNLDENSSLVGYINITLDIDALRLDWLRSNLLLWLLTIGLAIVWLFFILRKLNWSVTGLSAFANVCDSIVENPTLKQLPVIHPRFEFHELIQIRQAFTGLFNRLQQANQDYEALAEFEQQLHKKDLSLNMQHHNFQSMITHELKTSLNAIVGGLQLLEHQPVNLEQQDALDIIGKGSEQLVLTLEQIIQLNQLEKGQISVHARAFNPLQLIADLLHHHEPSAKQKGVVLISHIHHIDYNLEGDGEKIQQILSILLSNAIKFTPSGQVAITSQLTHFDKSNRWQISVKDSGIGIDANDIEDIFTPFFQVDSSQTRQYEGTGMGLPLVKQLTQLIGANIEVDSTPGVGTQFTLIIPLANQYQPRQQQVLAGVVVVYYYQHEVGVLVDELQRLGATVSCKQQGQHVIDEISTQKADIVMFAEDVLPSNAESLAKRIREHEVDHRALLIYWYPQQQEPYVDNFEHGLKAAGIDYCHHWIGEDKTLGKLLRHWLALP